MGSDRTDDLQVLTQELSQVQGGRRCGTVRWFSAERGFGFIDPDEGDDEVFVRHSGIDREGFRTLEAGQRVRYHLASDARGPRAIDVQPLG